MLNVDSILGRNGEMAEVEATGQTGGAIAEENAQLEGDMDATQQAHTAELILKIGAQQHPGESSAPLERQPAECAVQAD